MHHVVHWAVDGNNAREQRAMYMKILEVLVERGADVNAQDDMGLTPLHCAINTREDFDLESQRSCVRYLIQAGANIWQPCAANWSAVDMACKLCNTHIFSVMCEEAYEAYPDDEKQCLEDDLFKITIARSNGRLVAFMIGRFQCAKQLLDGQTPLNYALAHNANDETVDILLRYNAYPWAWCGVDPLEYCIKMRDPTLAHKVLVKQLRPLSTTGTCSALHGRKATLLMMVTTITRKRDLQIHSGMATILTILTHYIDEDIKKVKALRALTVFATQLDMKGFMRLEKGRDLAVRCSKVGLPIPCPKELSAFVYIPPVRRRIGW